VSVQQVIERLAVRLGTGAIEPGPEGEYTLIFDDQLDLQLLPFESSHLLIRSRLGTFPEARQLREGEFRVLLNRNLANLRRQSEIVTIDRQQRAVWIYRMLRIPADRTDESALFAVLEEFLNSLEWWRGVAKEASAPPPGPMMFLRP
jgi:hypothetical protein